jgi:hypothetical protein
MLLHEAEEERGLLLAAQFEVEEMVSTAELYLRAKRLPVRLERRVGPGKALGGLSESEVVGSPGPDGLIGRPVLALSAFNCLERYSKPHVIEKKKSPLAALNASW